MYARVILGDIDDFDGAGCTPDLPFQTLTSAVWQVRRPVYALRVYGIPGKRYRCMLVSSNNEAYIQ